MKIRTHTTLRSMATMLSMTGALSAGSPALPQVPAPKTAPKTTAAPAGSQAEQPALIVVEPEMDLGKVQSTKPQAFKVHLKNQGKSPVRITQVSAPCGCTAVAPLQTSLEPGAQVEIPVTFDPHGYYGVTVRQLDFTSDDPARPKFTWHFKADVQSPVIPQPKALGLNVVEGVTSASDSQFRFVPGRSAIKVKSLAFEGVEGFDILPKVTWKMENGEVKGSLSLNHTSYTLEMAAKERGQSRHGKLVLRLEDGSSDYIDTYWRLDGFVWAQPLAIATGDVPLGYPFRGQASVVWRMPLKNVVIKKITSSDPGLKAEVLPPATGGATNHQVLVTYTPSHTGEFKERVILEVEAEDTTNLNTTNPNDGAPVRVSRIVHINIFGRVPTPPDSAKN